MRYTCIDSFSGAGGLSLGLKRAGYEVLLTFDNDARCIETQLANPQYFNHSIIRSDVADMVNGEIRRVTGLARGELFLLSGGPPCQGFSVQRIGDDEDDRNQLVAQYMELVSDLRPHYFLMENVPGLTGKRGRRWLSDLTQAASDLGYWTHQKILDAQDFGVPQRRKRLFIVGERMDGPLAFFRFPTPTTSLGHRVHVRNIIGALPPPPSDGTDHPDIPHHRRDRLSPINLQRLQALAPGQGRDYLPENLLADCHRISSDVIGHRNVYGRMAWDDVAPTITARFDSFTRGKFGHPEQARSISLHEGALLQTFPHDFLFHGSKVDIARQIGNAVPPLLAEAIGLQIIACHRNKHSTRQEI